MEQRMRFVLSVEAGEESMAALCRRFGVSRQNGYKWLARHREEGAPGLFDRSRAPHTHPQEVDAGVAERCLAVRRAHPSWGPVKVRAFLLRQQGGLRLPAASTIGALFDRAGLTVRRRLRRRATPAGARPFAPLTAANDAWAIDFKGWFRTGDGRRCDPLTLCDLDSRYLLRCQALAQTDTEHVWPLLDAAFREFGLPLRLRSDNGPPFASSGGGGLSRLAVNVIKAGVGLERIEPGKPQQNGRLERLHLTLLNDTARPPAQCRRAQAERFRAFQRLYNEERPHEALDNDTPAEHYAPSPRAWDGVLREPHYADDWEVRRVRTNGEIKWRGKLIQINSALAGEPVGLAEAADGAWRVFYGALELGEIDHRGERLKKPRRRGCGLVDNAGALPTGSTETAATADGNEPGNVSPMSPV
jgi:transposase InsO family protein